MKPFYRSSALVIFLLVIFALGGCTPAEKEDGITGYVEVEWSYISTPQSGWLVQRPVESGSNVNAGDLLFSLDDEQQQMMVAEASARVDQIAAQAQDLTTGARPPEIRALEAKLNEAKAQLEQARHEKERVLPLVARKLEPQAREDEVVANYNAAVARVEAAKQSVNVARLAGRSSAQTAALAAIDVVQAARNAASWSLEQRTVTARVGGRVEEVFHYPGEYVTAGMPVLALRTDNSLKVRFFVPQSALPQLQVGIVVHIKADGENARSDAVVSFIATSAEFTPPVIYSAASRDKLVFMVEARLPDSSNFLPGLPVDVHLP